MYSARSVTKAIALILEIMRAIVEVGEESKVSCTRFFGWLGGSGREQFKKACLDLVVAYQQAETIEVNYELSLKTFLSDHSVEVGEVTAAFLGDFTYRGAGKERVAFHVDSADKAMDIQSFIRQLYRKGSRPAEAVEFVTWIVKNKEKANHYKKLVCIDHPTLHGRILVFENGEFAIEDWSGRTQLLRTWSYVTVLEE